jgi:hypothetical protein
VGEWQGRPKKQNRGKQIQDLKKGWPYERDKRYTWGSVFDFTKPGGRRWQSSGKVNFQIGSA